MEKQAKTDVKGIKRGVFFDPETGKRTRTFPLGNEWDLSKSWIRYNIDREYKNLTEVPEPTQKLIKFLQEKIIADRFKFVSVMGTRDKWMPQYAETVMVVFVDSDKTDIVDRREKDKSVDFVKEEGMKEGQVIDGNFYFNEGTLSKLLKGTGLWCDSAHVRNDSFVVLEKKGLLRKRNSVWFDKTGVVIFKMECFLLENMLRDKQGKVNEAQTELEKKKAERDEIASLVVPNPTGLFLKSPQSHGVFK